MARRHSTYGQERSTDGAFDDDEMAAFLLGTWVSCRSTAVAQARYLAEEGILEIVFRKRGDTYQYHLTQGSGHKPYKAPRAPDIQRERYELGEAVARLLGAREQDEDAPSPNDLAHATAVEFGKAPSKRGWLWDHPAVSELGIKIF